MPISFQTNYASMVAANNLSTNSMFQTKTVQNLTSGYRINSSGDDAAGLAVANQYRSNIAELTQGVLNGNNAISTLQIVDGGLSNISTMLDRMKTLATQSASASFTGSRDTLDQEYQALKTEITRQATNIGLTAGGANTKDLSVYIGGAQNGASLDSSSVSVNLGAAFVDAASLGLGDTSKINSGTSGTTFGSAPDISGASTITLTDPITLTAFVGAGKVGSPTVVTISGTATGETFVADINSQLAGTGITAGLNSSGQLEFKGGAFSITAAGTDSTKIFGTAGTKVNSAMYGISTDAIAFNPANSDAQTLHFTVNGKITAVQIAAGLTQDQAVAAINSAMNSQGVSAVATSTTSVLFQGTAQFSYEASAAGTGTGPFTATTVTAASVGSNVSTAAATANATAAISAINSAIQALGSAQGTVGAGENKLAYAISLANSQIVNFSAAQSAIRDADVAKEAANLTKAQVLQQASVAAMAQANSAPQALLKLLQ